MAAVPSAVAKSTVTVRPLAAESVTVRPTLTKPELPSVTVLLLIESDGVASLSTMVPIACADRDDRVDRGAQVDGERLVVFVERVAERHHRERLRW